MTSCGTFDPAPLVAAARAVAFRAPGKFVDSSAGGVAWADPHPAPTIGAVAEALDVCPTTAARYIAGGRLRRDAADRAALALGLHPAIIWPKDWR